MVKSMGSQEKKSSQILQIVAMFRWHQLSFRKIHKSKIENRKLISSHLRFSDHFKGIEILLNSGNVRVFSKWMVHLVHT